MDVHKHGIWQSRDSHRGGHSGRGNSAVSDGVDPKLRRQPACLAVFDDEMGVLNAVRGNLALEGINVKFVSVASFGPPLAGLGDDQITLQFDKTLFADGKA